MISGRKITLPSGQAVTVVDHPAGYTFTIEGTDAELLAPDVLYLAEIIRTDPRFSAWWKSGGSRTGPLAEGRPVTADDLGVEAARTEPAPPDLPKGGGDEDPNGVHICECGHIRRDHDADETTLTIPCFAHVLGRVCPCTTFKRARVRMPPRDGK